MAMGGDRIYPNESIRALLEQDLAPFFQSYGFVSDIRLQSERGFAFIKYGNGISLSTRLG